MRGFFLLFTALNLLLTKNWAYTNCAFFFLIFKLEAEDLNRLQENNRGDGKRSQCLGN